MPIPGFQPFGGGGFGGDYEMGQPGTMQPSPMPLAPPQSGTMMPLLEGAIAPPPPMQDTSLNLPDPTAYMQGPGALQPTPQMNFQYAPPPKTNYPSISMPKPGLGGGSASGMGSLGQGLKDIGGAFKKIQSKMAQDRALYNKLAPQLSKTFSTPTGQQMATTFGLNQQDQSAETGAAPTQAESPWELSTIQQIFSGSSQTTLDGNERGIIPGQNKYVDPMSNSPQAMQNTAYSQQWGPKFGELRASKFGEPVGEAKRTVTEQFNSLNEQFQGKVYNVMKDMEAKGWNPIIRNGLRSPEQAAANAKAGSGVQSSRHLSGFAADIVPREFSSPNLYDKAPKQFWNDLREISVKHGLRSGMDFKKIDRPHIDMQPNIADPSQSSKPWASNQSFKGIQEPFAEKAHLVMEELRSKGYQPYVPEGSGIRTAEQAAANAKKGVGIKNSLHITGNAMDIVDKRYMWNTDKYGKEITQYRKDLGEIAKKHGLEWGGEWTQGKYGPMGDWAHIQTASPQYAQKMGWNKGVGSAPSSPINQAVQASYAVNTSNPIIADLAAAQAVLESRLQGTPSALAAKHNNYFGIKGTGTAGVARMSTKEYGGKGSYTTKAGFAAYKSPEDSFRAHNELMNKPRYESVRNATNFGEAAKAVQASGYATDPKYAQKLIQINNDVIQPAKVKLGIGTNAAGVGATAGGTRPSIKPSPISAAGPQAPRIQDTQMMQRPDITDTLRPGASSGMMDIRAMSMPAMDRGLIPSMPDIGAGPGGDMGGFMGGIEGGPPLPTMNPDMPDIGGDGGDFGDFGGMGDMGMDMDMPEMDMDMSFDFGGFFG